MISKPDKNKIRQRRHMRVRGKISGTAERPRLSVYRSNKNIYAQLIDDVKGVTLASASTLDSEVSGNTKTEQAASVGALIAKRGVERTSAALFLTVVVTCTMVVYKPWLKQLVKTVCNSKEKEE